MNLFETVKASVSVPAAARMYGLRPNHHGMVRCPFHDDRHPSMKLNKDYFYCFGCGATGDVIDLTARLFDLRPYDAAKKLAADFGIDPDKPPSAAVLVKPKYPLTDKFRDDERYCQRVLCDYLHLLEDWKVQYAPKSMDEKPADLLKVFLYLAEGRHAKRYVSVVAAELAAVVSAAGRHFEHDMICRLEWPDCRWCIVHRDSSFQLFIDFMLPLCYCMLYK